MELQVGDRVRLTEYGLERFSRQSRGGEGEVVNVYRVSDYYYPFIYRVKWDHSGRDNIYTPKDLELVNFNEEELYY